MFFNVHFLSCVAAGLSCRSGFYLPLSCCDFSSALHLVAHLGFNWLKDLSCCCNDCFYNNMMGEILILFFICIYFYFKNMLKVASGVANTHFFCLHDSAFLGGGNFLFKSK